MLPSSALVRGVLRETEERRHTINLDLQPFEGSSGKLLLGSSVLERVRNRDFREVL